ncbi:MAG: hypothetical protein ABJA81_11865 [Nocardioidaceae bacterium]
MGRQHRAVRRRQGRRRTGNGDGWACARPGKVVTDENGNPFQLYNFIDSRVVVH